jgi:methanol--5-hydroxybenzimidazolylcobamide Co-methyltransferase
MRCLWREIVHVAWKYGVVAGGDSACGFANTAMQLAGRHMLPDCVAAVVRAMSAARSLVAFECGAIGPAKDCAYENPVLKAITGCPISMEGRSATCAHLSPLGNIAAAAADLWSNESVPDVRLLSGPAPVASLESLAYDCRLLNAAIARGSDRELRDLHVASDASYSCQAALLTPAASMAIARAIAAESDRYRRTIAAGRVALDHLTRLHTDGRLEMSSTEQRWVDRLLRELDRLPDDADRLAHETHERYGQLYERREYELES